MNLYVSVKMGRKNLRHGLHRIKIYLGLFPLLCLTVAGCESQQSRNETRKELFELRAQIENLKRNQSELQVEVSEIRQAAGIEDTDAESQVKPKTPPDKPPLPMKMEIFNSPVIGQKGAPVVLIEFTDYQCPFCKRHFETVQTEIIKTYVETGKVKYVLKQYPLQKLHPLAPEAAIGALCAGRQSQYWSMHDMLFENQRDIGRKSLTEYAKALGLDTTQFDDCVDKRLVSRQVMADFNLGVSAGVVGTPFFFLGLNEADSPNEVTIEKYLYGAQPYNRFREVIEGLLAQAARDKK